MTEHPKKRRFGGWLVAIVGLALAVAMSGYGIWSLKTSVTNLQQTANDAALPNVQVASPKHGPPTQALTLPGEVRAWNEAPIYAQVSGYVTQWFKDYGARVNAGDVLATINTPSLDAQFEASKARLAVAHARYKLAVITAKRSAARSPTQAVARDAVD